MSVTFQLKGTSNNFRMRLAMSYFGFRRGESKEHSLSYVIDIQRSMNFKRAIEPEPWLRHPGREWVVRGALKCILSIKFYASVIAFNREWEI